MVDSRERLDDAVNVASVAQGATPCIQLGSGHGRQPNSLTPKRPHEFPYPIRVPKKLNEFGRIEDDRPGHYGRARSLSAVVAESIGIFPKTSSIPPAALKSSMAASSSSAMSAKSTASR